MRKETVITLAILLLTAGYLTQTKAILESSIVIGSYGSVYYDPDQMDSVSLIVALDGSGNFTDIQDAIDAVPPNTLGHITVRSGTYILNPQYHWPFKSIILKSNIVLRGEGIDQTIIKSFPDKQPVGSSIRATTIASGTIESVWIEDLTIIQNGSPDNRGNGAIKLGGCTNVTIRNIKVTDVTGEALQFSGNDNLVENCIFNRSWTGIGIAGPNDGAIIRNNQVFNTVGDAIFPQALGGPVINCLIESNYCENIGDTAIDITGIKEKGYRQQNIQAIGNTIVNGLIRITGADHIIIRDNIIRHGAISIDPGEDNPTDVLIQGNFIEGFPWEPTNYDPTYYSAGVFGKGYNVTVTSNIIFSNRTTALYAVATWGTWIVTNNGLLVPGKSGNAAVNAHGLIQGNYEYVP